MYNIYKMDHWEVYIYSPSIFNSVFVLQTNKKIIYKSIFIV